jgi:hypothetical protein
MKTIRRGLAGFVLVLIAMPVLAVYNQQVVLTGGPELASATISFTSADGKTETVTTQAEDDHRVAYIAFGGSSSDAGTLNITANGKTQSFNLPATSGGRVIRVNTLTGAVLVDPASAPAAPPQAPASGVRISMFGGVGSVEVPAIGSAAVQSTVDGESALLKTDDNVDIDAYGLQFDFPIGDKGWRMQLFATSYSGDDDDSAQLAPLAGGGIDTAIVFQQESPTYGTGFFGGLTPVDSYGKLDIEGDKYGLSMSWPCPRFDNVMTNAGVYYQSADLDQKQWDGFVGVDVSSYRHAEVSQDSWLATLGATYVYPFNEHFAATFSAGAMLQYYDANLDSTQEITFFADPTEVLEKHDSDDAWALGGYVGMGLPMTFGRLSVTPSAILESGLVTAQVEYPRSGDEVLAGKEVELQDDNATNWAVTVTISIGL